MVRQQVCEQFLSPEVFERLALPSGTVGMSYPNVVKPAAEVTPLRIQSSLSGCLCTGDKTSAPPPTTASVQDCPPVDDDAARGD